MIRLVSWEVEAGGRSFKFNPIRVRDRIRLSDQLAEERAREAAKNAALVGMNLAQSAEHVGSERRKALGAHQLLLDCYSVKGALRVLAESCGGEEAIEFAGMVEPDVLTNVALSALGVDVDARSEEPPGK